MRGRRRDSSRCPAGARPPRTARRRTGAEQDGDVARLGAARPAIRRRSTARPSGVSPRRACRGCGGRSNRPRGPGHCRTSSLVASAGAAAHRNSTAGCGRDLRRCGEQRFEVFAQSIPEQRVDELQNCRLAAKIAGQRELAGGGQSRCATARNTAGSAPRKR